MKTAVALADELLATFQAAALGQREGLKTAKRGPDCFARIAALRKTLAGGRPRNKS